MAAIVLCTTTPWASANSRVTTSAFSQIASCISGAENVLVSIVVDESLSLRSTDPKALRVQGITTAVDSLEQLSAHLGESTNVEVSLSTFARSFETFSGWRELTAETAQDLRSTAGTTLPGRDAGNATDYRQALLGAKKNLDDRQRHLGDANACKLLLWFTDGALDVDSSTDIAREEICQVGGIADAVRADGIAVVALALFTPGGGVTRDQREELRAVAEGRGQSTTCGTVPLASDSATGVYLPADDPASLQRLFAGAGALVAGATEVETVNCPGPQCEGGSYLLKIDRGLAGARVLVQSAGLSKVDITSPSGESFELVEGEAKLVDGAQVTYLPRGQLATVNIGFAPYSSARSEWVIEPHSASELSIYWFWGAELSLVTEKLRAGASDEVAIRVVDQNSHALPVALYRGVRARIRVGDRQLRARLTRDGVMRGVVELGTQDLPASLPVTASLAVRSVPGGVRLGPITLSERLPVTLPPAYATVKPKQIDFGHLEGSGTASAKLTLIGSQIGPTQVCVTGSKVRLPGQEAASAAIVPDAECLDLGAEERKELSLQLTPETAADGVANGELQLRLTAADGAKDLAVTVPTRLEMARTVDEGTRWALVALLIGIALLLPAAMIVGSNYFLARFVLTSMARTASKPIRVSPSGLQPVQGSTLLEPEDFNNASFSGVLKSRRIQIEGTGIALRGRRVFSLKEPFGVAVGPAGRTLVSSTSPYRGESATEAPASLGEVDAAFLLIDHNGASKDEAHGTLIMTVPGDVDRQGIHDRAARMSSLPPWQAILADVLADTPLRPSPGHCAGADSGSDEVRAPSDPSPSRGDDSDAPDGADRNPTAPPAPAWERPDAASTRAEAPTSERKRRLTKARLTKARKSQASARSSPPPASQDGDSLPPLPDFLQ